MSALVEKSLADGEWLPARTAAALLGVSLGTLYSYVSRGLLHPVADGVQRGKRYRRAEVQRLARRHADARQPRRVAGAALDFGLPVLESGLSLIEHGRLYYRGHDALRLADAATLEDIAATLWGCAPAISATPAVPRRMSSPAVQAMPQRMLSAFHRVVDAWGGDTGGEPATAWRWVQAMLVAATGRAPARGAPGLHRQLAAAWGLDARAADELRRALVLCADHELNASSFTARCVASTGASPSAALAAALAALSGARHGGLTAEVEAMWPHKGRFDGLPPGFGHALYPDGDPRGRYLLQRLPCDKRRDRFVAAVHQRHGVAPTLDFGLVALRRALGAPPGAAFAIFAIGRSVGWLAHVFEQQRGGALIRPRAAYVGPLPESAQRPAGRVIRRR